MILTIGVFMKESITNKQYIFVLFGALVGYGIMGLPKVLAEEAETGAWISIIMATIVAVILTLCITYLNYTHKEKTLYEYSELLLGKVLSKIVVIIYIVFFFALFTLIVRLTSEVIKYSILPNTPYWAICLALITLVVFAVSKGMGNVVRLSVLLGIFVMLVAISTHIVVFMEAEAVNLQPVLGTGEVMDYFKGAGMAVLSFIGIEVLLLLPLGKQNDKKIFAYNGITAGVIGLFYIFVVLSCIGVMGVHSIVHYRDALLATIRRVSIEELDFLKRLDGIVIVGWIMAVVTTLSFLGYGVASLTNKFFKDNNRSYNWVVIIVGILAFIGTIIIPDFEQVREWLNYATYGAAFTAAFIPILLSIITRAKGYGKIKE